MKKVTRKPLMALLTMLLALVSCDKCEFCDCGCKDCPGCDDDCCTCCVVNPVYVNLGATIKASQTKVCEGDKMELSLADISGLEELDKVENRWEDKYSLEVEYLVDGRVIGSSSDKNKNFAVNYTIKGLSLGNHTLSVRCKTGKSLEVTVSVQDLSFYVDVVKTKVKLFLGGSGRISKDLAAFVTPVVTYTDYYGDHDIVIAPYMYKEDTHKYKGLDYIDYSWTNDIEACVIPSEVFDVKLHFVPIEGTKVEAGKKYYADNNFSINSYHHSYKGIHIGTIISISLGIVINIGGSTGSGDSDCLIDAGDMEAYIRQLCASESIVKVLLEEDGKVTIKQ